MIQTYLGVADLTLCINFIEVLNRKDNGTDFLGVTIFILCIGFIEVLNRKDNGTNFSRCNCLYSVYRFY